MDLRLPEEVQMITTAVRRFVEEELHPIEMKVPAGPDLPEPHWGELTGQTRALGLWSLEAPARFGGGGLNALGEAAVYAEKSRTTAGWGVFGNAGPNILYDASPEQQARYLLAVIRGEMRYSFGLTEPSTGADPASMLTRAARENDHYVINGAKTFISNVDRSDYILLFCKTDSSKGRLGVSCIITPTNTPGFKIVRRIHTSHAFLSSFELAFDDMVVPAENLVGEEGRGFALGQRWLGRNRLMFGARHIGMGERLIPMAAQYAKLRVTFGQPIASRQAIQWMLADSWIEYYALKWMTYYAACKYDRGDDCRQEMAAIKAYSGDVSFRLADNAMQIFGAVGTSTDLPIERYWRYVRHTRIGEGSQEMMKFVLARNILRD